MLKQSPKHKSEGFTIIEVLIVLAIAGLIMIVIFLAVPALNRSGRNNVLINNVKSIMAATSNYPTQNGGLLPGSVGLASGVVTIGDSGTNQETAKVDGSITNVVLNGTTITATGGGASSVGTVQVITGTNAVCNATASGLGTAGSASPRAVAVLYVAESGSGNILKCLAS